MAALGRLGRLPPELRDAIYKWMMIADGTVYYAALRPRGDSDKSAKPWMKNLSGLALASKALRAEYLAACLKRGIQHIEMRPLREGEYYVQKPLIKVEKLVAFLRSTVNQPKCYDLILSLGCIKQLAIWVDGPDYESLQEEDRRSVHDSLVSCLEAKTTLQEYSIIYAPVKTPVKRSALLHGGGTWARRLPDGTWPPHRARSSPTMRDVVHAYEVSGGIRKIVRFAFRLQSRIYGVGTEWEEFLVSLRTRLRGETVGEHRLP